MRLWSVHPSYLDSKGLVAVWREGLLAFHVLSGKTKGYVNHPQLIRFKKHSQPLEAIVWYLHAIVDEADRRGYSFRREKLPAITAVKLMDVNRGQLEFEMKHLLEKLSVRDPNKFSLLKDKKIFLTHPIFKLVQGEIESWEKQK